LGKNFIPMASLSRFGDRESFIFVHMGDKEFAMHAGASLISLHAPISDKH
jgi:hypothetical protein